MPTNIKYFEILKNRQNKSSPGSNEISCLVYKENSVCADILYIITCRIIKEGIFPPSYGKALITLIPKDPSNLNDVSQFRPIACLDVENKILWAIVGLTLLSFLIVNGFLNDRTQKGFLPFIAGCIEHSATLAEAIGDARCNKKNIVINWLDLANAFGSVRHSLITFSFGWYHVPTKCINLITLYYASL